MQSTSPHAVRQLSTAKEAFAAVRPGGVGRRSAEIAALPVVKWKGRVLRALRCCGTTGKGPHTVNVPEALLWSLMDLGGYRCPYHAGDWGQPVLVLPR